MNDLSYISIGIPFYNAEQYLEDAICSVLAQRHKKWELILIDDGSTDRSLNIAECYAQKDPRIRVLSDSQNRKLPYRLNQIIQEAKYDFIARMDADDIMSDDRIERQLKILENNKDIDFVTTGYLAIDKDNNLIGVRLGKNYRVTKEQILEGSTNLVHASLLARKSWYLRNQYNENSILAEDFDLWLQAAKMDDLKYEVIESPLYFYRVSENVTKKKILQGYLSQIKIIKENYDNVITAKQKEKIIRKFYLKKLIVEILEKMGLLHILLKKRSDKYSAEQLKFYNKQILNLKKYKI